MNPQGELTPEEHARPEEHYGLQGAYLDAYDAIVKPHQVCFARLYTLRRWAPILEAPGFWLLIALQQACYRNPYGRTWCVISGEDLAEEAGISRTTVYRYLRDGSYAKYQLRRWVHVPDPDAFKTRKHWSAKAQQVVQQANKYQVLLDPPLTREDQRGLAHLLLTTGPTDLDHLLRRTATQTFNDTLAMLSAAADAFVPSDNWEADDWYPTPQAVARVVWGDLSVMAKRKLGRIYQIIKGPKKIIHQYFRKRWLPELKPKLALVVLQLRSRGFWDEDELRDRVELSYTKLAHETGASTSWLRDIHRRRPESKLFFTARKRGPGRSPMFQIKFLEPIAPQDHELYEARLSQEMGENGQWGFRLGDETATGETLVSPTTATGETLERGKTATDETLEGPEPATRETLKAERPLPVKHNISTDISTSRDKAPLSANGKNGLPASRDAGTSDDEPDGSPSDVEPPACFPQLFTTAISDIKEMTFTKSEWEAILEAEKARGEGKRGERTRITLVGWLERKLNGSRHPAIQVYYDEMDRYPRRNTFSDIIECVGETNLALWRQIVKAWKLHGWNIMNVGGMIECYERGEVPTVGGGRGNGSNREHSHRHTRGSRRRTEGEVRRCNEKARRRLESSPELQAILEEEERRRERQKTACAC